MASLALAFDILARDRASKTFNDVGSAAERAGKKGGGFGQAMSGAMSLAGKAVAAGSAGVVAGLGVSIKKAMDFDKTMRTVGATLNANGPVQKELSALAMKLGKDTVFSAGEASDAMLELAKGGMDAAQIKAGALSSTLTLAAAGGLELGNAAGYMVKALTTFGLKASDAGKVAAALAGGANASTASVEDLGLALSQVGPGAKLAGLSLQDTTAALALFSDNGIRGSDAGTSLKTMLVGLVPDTEKTINAFQDLGLLTFNAAKGMKVLRDNGIKPLGSDAGQLTGQLQDLAAKLTGSKVGSATAQKEYMKLAMSTGALSNQFFDAKGNIKSMAEVANTLQKALAGQSREQKIATLNTLFGSDASRAAAILTASGAKGLAKYVKATNDQTSAQKMAKTATEGASGAWEAFKGSVETIAITLGVKLLPLFTNVVTKANDIAGVVLDKMGPAIDDATSRIKGFIDEFQKGEGAGGKFRDILSRIGEALRNAGQWIKDNSTWLGALTVAVLTGVGVWKTYRLGVAIVTAVTKAYTAAQIALNLAMRANPIGIVITVVAALAAGLIYAYQTSDKFRSYVTTAFSMVKIGALTLAGVAIGAFQKLLNFWFIVVGGLLEGANKAFSWVPGIGPKLSEASKAFIKFRDDTNASLNGIQNDIQLNIDTEKAKLELEELHREFIDKGWTVTAEARTSLVYVGNGMFAPTGGGTGGGAGGSLERPVQAAAGAAWGHYPNGGVHRALDFPVAVGTPVRAPMSGQVVQDGWDPGGFGVHVRTRDSDGNFTILGHLSREMVTVGQRIAKGQVIGYSGNTGHSTGPHLHMERRHSLYDPKSAFNFTAALGGLNARGGAVKPLLFDSGGVLPTGISVVRNDTGKPEPLARVGDGRRMFSDADLDYLAAAVERGASRGTSAGFGRQVQEASWGARV